MPLIRPLLSSVLVLFLLAPGRSLGGQIASVGKVGLLVVAHGADSGWNSRVRAVMADVQWDGPRALAFLMGPDAMSDGWDAAIAALEGGGADRLVVVPLMVSSHGAHVRQIRHYAGLDEALPEGIAEMGGHADARRPLIPVRVVGALDAAPELGEIMLARWRSLPREDRARELVLVAHGPGGDEDAESWLASLEVSLRPLRDSLGGRALHLTLLRDDAAVEVRAKAVRGIRDTIEQLAKVSGDSVVVMTVLVSSGSIDRQRIPEDLMAMPIRYLPSVLAPHPALARWIARVAGDAS